ncbi:MAG TPA: alpha/beta hydrolase [Gaiellales bacterium]|jgi:acetyl esterase/lipase|nr:alpha/beta hydrolase [Gaiellales bacterium]
MPETDLVKALYERWSAAFAEEPEMPLDRWRAMIEEWPQVTAEPGGVDYVEVEAGGVLAMWVMPKGAAEDRVILSIHGGGFVVGSMYTHRKLFGHLAKMVGARALVPDYRRPPEHLHPAPLEDVVSAYEWVLDQGIEASHVALTGDSAGGGMVVTAMFLARDRGLPLPAAGMPFSAWFDLEGAGRSQETNADTDKLLNKRFGDQLAEILLGESGERRDPYVSALYGDLGGLPPLYLQVSDAETLLDDSRSFAEKARGAGVEVRLDVFPGQQHTFQMAAGRSPTADDAIRRLADWVRPHLGL